MDHLFAGRQHDVPFTVRNRTVNGRAVAERTLHLPAGDWTMKDVVSARSNGQVIDRIGEPPSLAAAFDVDVDGEGSLLLRSRAVGLRVGRLRLRVPAPFAPVIRLRESPDPAANGQRVHLTVDLPVVGRLYEYRGSFRYRIEKESA
ncbi:DUF4166 domain-containing protein [Microbacterium sp.]|uniref:DUF4166 domain-containing protein n=1 Tax=Microbacterium sp. TaxID=51671 RepID=UPI0028123496|nr:DUF4166 domain-containing protein [Microbacterium sp.]